MDSIARSRRTSPFWSLVIVGLGAAAGCGTTNWSDTPRTATEQLLISDAIDRAVSRIDFCALAGKQVYLDATPIQRATDASYLVSTLRQHMLASGCILRDERDKADYVVEIRAGAVGTDRSELLFGVPATKIPQVVPVPGVPSSIPEFKLATRTEQRAVAKIALFAYNRHTGRPVWQSGIIPVESKAKDLWVLGAGPFQQGTIYDGTNFAGDRLSIPLIDLETDKRQPHISVAEEAFFAEPDSDTPVLAEGENGTQLAAQQDQASAGKGPAPKAENAPNGKVIPAEHAEPISHPAPGASSAASPAAHTSAGPAAEDARNAVAPAKSASASSASAPDHGPPTAGPAAEADGSETGTVIRLRTPALLPEPGAGIRPLADAQSAPHPPSLGTVGPEARWVVPLDHPSAAPP